METCAEQLVAALEAALNRLSLRYAKPASRLRWGEAHVARFRHAVLSRIPVIGGFFEYQVETDGGSYTLNRAGVSFSEHGLFENRHGPGYRAVYDLADLDNSRFMIATGQSGNPLSALYGSLSERWRDGDYLKLVGGETEARHRLTLNPR